VFGISATLHRWVPRGEPRARRKEHLALENAILRRRSTSAFSHGQDPQRPSPMWADCDASIRCSVRRELVVSWHLLFLQGGSNEAAGVRWISQRRGRLAAGGARAKGP